MAASLSISLLQIPAAAEQIKTRVAQENFDAFIKSCRSKSLPAATCECMALKMIDQGRDGEIALDVIGLQARNITDKAAEKREFVGLLDRYHVTPTQAQSALASAKTHAEQFASQCN